MRTEAPSATASTATGSVAEEAARLVELLSRGRGPADAAGPSSRASEPGAGDEAGEPVVEATTDSEGGTPGPCTCGGRRDATPTAPCRACPVCQVISLVQQVSPETIDRVAEVVELAATALRDFAMSRRGDSDPQSGPRP